MANEQNYNIVLLHNPNEVDDAFSCPACHCNDTDMLVIDDNDEVKCLNCGCEYIINA